MSLIFNSEGGLYHSPPSIEKYEDYKQVSIPEVLIKAFTWDVIKKTNENSSKMEAATFLYHELSAKDPRDHLLDNEIETSYQQLSKLFRWSLKKTENFIKELEEFNLASTRYHKDKLIINLDPRTAINLDLEINNQNLSVSIITELKSLKNRYGIYFLLRDDLEVIYVGVSYASIFNRIGVHRRGKSFSHIAILSISDAFLNLYEKVLISHIQPLYNKKDIKFKITEIQKAKAIEITQLLNREMLHHL